MGRQLSGSCSHFCYCCPAALSHIILCLCFSCLCGVYLHRDCKPLWLLQSSHGLEVFTARPWAHRGPSASSFSFVLPQCRVVLLIPLICLTCKKKKNWFLLPSPLLSVVVQSTDRSPGYSTLCPHREPRCWWWGLYSSPGRSSLAIKSSGIVRVGKLLHCVRNKQNHTPVICRHCFVNKKH